MSSGEVRFRRRFGKFSPWKIADLDRNQQRDDTGFKRGERVGEMGRRDVPQSTRHPSLVECSGGPNPIPEILHSRLSL